MDNADLERVKRWSSTRQDKSAIADATGAPIENVETRGATAASGASGRSGESGDLDSAELHERVKRARTKNRSTSVSPLLSARERATPPHLQLNATPHHVVYEIGTVGHITQNRSSYSLDDQVAAIKMKAYGAALDEQTGMRPINQGCCAIS
jgi:hypothetical protein